MTGRLDRPAARASAGRLVAIWATLAAKVVALAGDSPAVEAWLLVIEADRIDRAMRRAGFGTEAVERAVDRFRRRFDARCRALGRP